jgi:hypothetical protein
MRISGNVPPCVGLRSYVLALLLLLPVALNAGKVTLVDGVPHVSNQASPPQGVQAVQLEELWRAGGEDDDVFFGLISKVCCDEQGDIYILDSQVCKVYVYSPDGRLLRTLFGEGDGPGEVRRPRSLALLGDGTVGVIQEFPGRMVRVDRLNNPAPSIAVLSEAGQGAATLDGCFAGGPTLVFSGVRLQQAVQGIEGREQFLSIYSIAGKELARLVSARTARDYNRFVFAEKNEMPAFYWVNDVGPDGRVYTAPRRDEYTIEVYSPQGKLERVISREYEHLKRSAAAYRRLHGVIDSIFRRVPFEYTIEIEKDEYDILAMQQGIRVRDDGSIWVLPGRGAYDQPEGVMLTFDVFDAEGHFQRQVAIRGDHDGVWDGFFFAGGDRAVVVTRQVEAIGAQYGDGAAVLSEEGGSAMDVICYRMGIVNRRGP